MSSPSALPIPIPVVAPPPRPVTFTNDDDELGVPLARTFTLLPLRAETRFLPANGQTALYIRIYPDQIAIDSFDGRLTTGELADATAYGQQIAPCANTDTTAQPAATATQQTAWQFLANRYGAGRAAYLADAVLPATQLAAWLNAAPGTVLQAMPGVQLCPASLTTKLQALGSRPSSYAQAPLARCLPTRWLVYGLTNGAGTIAYEIGRSVNGDLTVGPAGATPTATGTLGGASVDPAMLWMVDFQAAVNAGMAAVLPLTQAQAASGFTNLYVVGICDNDPAAIQANLEQLLTAHRFTDGWAIVPQGTPTKNSDNSPSGFSTNDPNFANSFAAERQLPMANAVSGAQQADGTLLANALGLSAASVAHLQGTAGSNESDAACMAQTLWAGTIGYYQQFIEQSGGLPSVLATAIQNAFVSLVRGRGPLPAMRIANVPYGVLPTGIISQLLPADNNNPLIPVLNKAWTSWQVGIQGGDQEYLGKSGDDLTDLGAVADLTPSSTNFLVTEMTDSDFSAISAEQAWNAPYDDQVAISDLYIASPAGKGVPPAQWLVPYSGPHGGQRPGLLLAFPLGSEPPMPGQTPSPVVANVLDESPPTPTSETAMYIQHLCEVYAKSGDLCTVQALINESSIYGGGAGCQPSTGAGVYFDLSFLYLTLRASLLISLGLACATVLGIEPPAESELVDFAGEPGTPTQTLQRIIGRIAPGGLPACQAVFKHQNDSSYAGFFNLGKNLQRLASISSAELQRLFTETLDCAVARIDAWITAFATAQLAEYSPDNIGKVVGGYAWLQNVLPDTTPASGADVTKIEQIENAVAAETGTPPVPVSDIRAADVDNGGFAFAPSANQAATVAILRNADLTNKDAGELGIPLNLSSARVRNAISYLNGVRQGSSLGVLMGERAEEALADTGLSAYVQPLRDMFPLIANKLTQSSPSQTASDVAAPNVVDGVALEQAMANGSINWSQVVSSSGAQLTPQQAANDAASLPVVLGFLSDDLASISDLSTSETIFQIVRGNPERGGSILDAIQSGAQIPEPQIVSTPRTGLAVTQRVLSIGGGDPNHPPASPWGVKTARALAEPWLEAWLGSILPPAAAIGFACIYTGPNKVIVMTVADLGLGALDLLAMDDTPDASLGSDLQNYILYKALAKGAPAQPKHSQVEIYNLTEFTTAVPLGDVLPVLLAARDLLSRSRALQMEDLGAPSGSSLSGTFNPELQSRVLQLGTSFSTAIGALAAAIAGFNLATATAAQATQLVNAMLAMMMYGIPNAVPQAIAQPSSGTSNVRAITAGLTPAEYESLLAQAKTVLGQAQKRSAAYGQVQTSPASLQSLTAAAEAILGSSFLVVPLVTVGAGTNFLQSMTDWQSGVNGANNGALTSVIQQLTHVRPAIAALDLFRSSVAIVNQSRIVDFTVSQVPYTAGAAPWLVLPVEPQDSGNWPASWMGQASLILWMPVSLSSSAPYVYGLVFDEWTERIPSKREKAAIAFHYAEPLAQAPQAILIALANSRVQVDGPPSLQNTWNYQTLLQVLQDTFTLVKARVTDPTDLMGLSQLIMAQNTNNDTVSTFPLT
jgi:hypothetical protein